MGTPGGIGRALRGAVVVMLALGAACGPSEPAVDPEAGIREVKELLRLRGARLETGDIDGYLRAVAPEARALEEAIVRGAGSVPLVGVHIVFRPPASSRSYATVFRDAGVEVQFGYQGLPGDNVSSFLLRADFERRAGEWTVTRAEPDPARPLPLWATGPVEVTGSKHFLAIHRPGAQRVADALDLAETARRNLLERLTFEPEPRQLLVLAGDHAEMTGLAGDDLSPGTVAYASWNPIGIGLRTGRQVVLDLAYLFGWSTSDPVLLHGLRDADLVPLQVVQHELGHLALRPHTAALVPDWVVEGGAMLLSGEQRTFAWEEMVRNDNLGGLSFADLNETGELDGRGYAYANAAVSYLVETYGADRFWEFYTSFLSARLEGPGDLLMGVFGLSPDELDARTIEWMRGKVGRQG